MYKIQLIMMNAITGDTVQLTYQFDPATMNATKWAAAWPTVQTSLTELVASSTPKEPQTW